MSGRELRINVYDSSKVGHANVSFYRDGEHQYTIGANIRLEVPQLALPRVLPFEPDDGIYRDESAFHLSAIVQETLKSAAVPITDMQYDALLDIARSLENETFNYSVFTKACVELVEDFYAATGHPGEFGDLFAAEDRSGSLVWSRVPVSDDNPISTWPDGQPLYAPPDPIFPDPPTLPTPIVFTGMPNPPAISSEEPPAEGVSPRIISSEDDQQTGLRMQDQDDDTVGLDYPHFIETTPAIEFDFENFPPLELRFDGLLEPVAERDGLFVVADSSNAVEIGGFSDPNFPTALLPSDATAPDLAFPESLTKDPSFGQTQETLSLGTVVATSSDSNFDRPIESPAASPSPSSDLGTSFDTGADSFDFRPTEPNTDLNFGQEYGGRDLMEALSIPAEEMGYSFDSQSYSHDDDHTEYNHGYDEFGII